MIIRSLLGLVSLVPTLLMTGLMPATAQDYPARTVTLVVPFAAGGPVDNGGRTFADALRRHLGQAVVIDNKPGAGGVVGTRAVAAAKPDGYTLLVGSLGPLVIAPAANPGSFDVERQLSPVGLIAQSPQILVLNPAVPAKTLQELVALAKAKPGAMHFGSAGIGTTPHLAGELLKAQTGIDLVHVPFRGTGAALPDLLSGRIEMLFGDITSVAAMVESGRLRPLLIAAQSRSPLVPAVPTSAEQGMPNLLSRNWNALMGPPGLPANVVARLELAMRHTLKDQAYLDALARQGASAAESSAQHLLSFLAQERAALVPIIKAIGLKLE